MPKPDGIETYLRKAGDRALKRGIAWRLPEADAVALWEMQRGACAYTGVPLTFGKQGTASLDRVSSLFGYTPGNVQWVHKTINYLKQRFEHHPFVAICTAVATRGAAGSVPDVCPVSLASAEGGRRSMAKLSRERMVKRAKKAANIRWARERLKRRAAAASACPESGQATTNENGNGQISKSCQPPKPVATRSQQKKQAIEPAS